MNNNESSDTPVTENDSITIEQDFDDVSSPQKPVVIDLNEFDFAPAWVKQLSKSPQTPGESSDAQGSEKKPQIKGHRRWPQRNDLRHFKKSEDRSQKRLVKHQKSLPHQNQTPHKQDAFARQSHGPADTVRHIKNRQRAQKLPVKIELVPEITGTESVCRQIKVTGRSYPVYDLAKMILQKPERYTVRVSLKAFANKHADTQEQSNRNKFHGIFLCKMDGSLWLKHEDAVTHVLKNFIECFYEKHTETIPPPKGNFTHVAICGITNTPLCPPNYHGYQTLLREHYLRSKIRIPFDVYKLRIKIVKDEQLLKDWLEKASLLTYYTPLTQPRLPWLRKTAEAADAPPIPAFPSTCTEPFQKPEETPTTPLAETADESEHLSQTDLSQTHSHEPTEEVSSAEPSLSGGDNQEQKSHDSQDHPNTTQSSESIQTPVAQSETPERIRTEDQLKVHFTQRFAKRVIKKFHNSYQIRDVQRRNLGDQRIVTAIRSEVEAQSQNPRQIARSLMGQLRNKEMRFFTIDPNIIYVTAATPTSISPDDPSIKDSLRAILRYVSLNPRCNRRQLLHALVPDFDQPTPKSVESLQNQNNSTIQQSQQQPLIAPSSPAEASRNTPSLPTDGQNSASEACADRQLGVDQASAAEQPQNPQAEHPSEPQIQSEPKVDEKPGVKQALAVLKDLHLLVKQGHIIEFASGELELANPEIHRPLDFHQPQSGTPSQPHGKKHHQHPKGHTHDPGHPEHDPLADTQQTSNTSPQQIHSTESSEETKKYQPHEQTTPVAPHSHSGEDSNQPLAAQNCDVAVMKNQSHSMPVPLDDPYFDPEFDARSPIPAPSAQNLPR